MNSPPRWSAIGRSVIALTVGSLALLLALLPGCIRGRDSTPLTLLVMDPLARELACACVGGYAQRDYRQFAQFLGGRLGRTVEVIFADSLDKGVRQAGSRRPAIIIGKESLVQSDARRCGMALHPLSRLTDKTGTTSLTGLFIVRASDPAQAIADLRSRRILFGPVDSAEKHSAALAALLENGITPPATIETREGCGDAALDVQEDSQNTGLAAVISSYALPLLEGCGNIERGSLRVLGETQPVPFITAFATDSVPAEMVSCLQTALLAVRDDARLLHGMESRDGFVAWFSEDWPDWRGPNRNGQAAALPQELPAQPRVLWRKPLPSQGLAGIAATSQVVMHAGRDPHDQRDFFQCLRAADGEILWTLEYSAEGRVDYGQAPRATPVIRDDKVYLLGALGQLHCVLLASGEVIWKRHLMTDLEGKLPVWGYCGTPLVVDNLLIVNPGGKSTSLVALNRHTGALVWKSAGAEAGYASLIVNEFGGRRQIVGYDANSLGGWDCRTGKRLWTLVPPRSGDYNVPTPIALDGRLLVATENNGTRMYGFHSNGVIDPKPLAINGELSPETCTPVVVDGRAFGAGSSLVCLNLTNGLRQCWTADEDQFGTHASLMAADHRLLVLTHGGELILLDTTAPACRIVSRCRVSAKDSEIYAHPALAAGRLFIRDNDSIKCLLLR